MGENATVAGYESDVASAVYQINLCRAPRVKIKNDLVASGGLSSSDAGGDLTSVVSHLASVLCAYYDSMTSVSLRLTLPLVVSLD